MGTFELNPEAEGVLPLDAAAVAELLSYPARLLPQLPLGLVLELSLAGLPDAIVVETRAKPTEPAPVTERPYSVHFGSSELEALVLGAEAERLWPGDLRGLCLRKRHDPLYRLTAEEALAGAQPEAGAPLSLARVLARLDLRLVAAMLRVDELQDRPGVAAGQPPDQHASPLQAA